MIELFFIVSLVVSGVAWLPPKIKNELSIHLAILVVALAGLSFLIVTYLIFDMMEASAEGNLLANNSNSLEWIIAGMILFIMQFALAITFLSKLFVKSSKQKGSLISSL